MIEGMNGFGIEEYEVLKNAIAEAGKRINEFLTLEAQRPPEGL